MQITIQTWHRYCSVTQNKSVWSHGLQHTRAPCSSPSPRPCSNSCPLSQWCHPTISFSVVPFPSCLQSFSIKVFSNESVLHIRLTKYWSFRISISPSSEYSGLISFRIDWFDPLAAQASLKSLLQHHTLKASILWLSALLIVQLSYLYMTTGETIVLTIWTFVGKVISLLFNMPSRFVTDFLPRSTCILISWLQSPFTVILEPKQIKSIIVSIVFPSICHEVMGPDAPWSQLFECWVLSQVFTLLLHLHQEAL